MRERKRVRESEIERERDWVREIKRVRVREGEREYRKSEKKV